MTARNQKELTKAEIERGEGILFSIRIVINVLYALMIFQIFLILPRLGDPELAYLTLPQVYGEHINQLLVMVVGMILTVMYWIQFNIQMGNLVRSSVVHASLALTQMVFLMLYLYFLRFDMEFDGMKLALQMESVFLALAGFVAAFNWRYARIKHLTSDQITTKEELGIFYKILPEPLASAFSFPFAGFGPNIWSLAFLVIIPISYILGIVRKKQEAKLEDVSTN